MKWSFLRKDAAQEAGQALYAAAVEQARSPALYMRFGAPDTVEGRFELVVLHVYLVLRRLKGDAPGASTVGQKLFDAMFQNMDDSLRELGVGDLSVGKKVRKLVENFYGRVGAYEDAMKEDADGDELERVLCRNIFSAEDTPGAERFAAYVYRAAASIDAQPVSRIVGGIVNFPDPEEIL